MQEVYFVVLVDTTTAEITQPFKTEIFNRHYLYDLRLANIRSQENNVKTPFFSPLISVVSDQGENN